MDSTTIRIICAALVLVFGAVIMMRRKHKAE
jgi:hypothetical protein